MLFIRVFCIFLYISNVGNVFCMDPNRKKTPFFSNDDGAFDLTREKEILFSTGMDKEHLYQVKNRKKRGIAIPVNANINLDVNSETIRGLAEGAERMAKVFDEGVDKLIAPKISK